MPSRKSKYSRGLFITVLSSPDGTTDVAALAGRADVRHWIKVENLALYPADLDCVGRIPHAPPRVRFQSGNAGDTAMSWHDNYPGLAASAIYDFSHVTLLAGPSAAPGAEIVCADITAVWPQPARNESHTLDIQVSP